MSLSLWLRLKSTQKLIFKNLTLEFTGYEALHSDFNKLLQKIKKKKKNPKVSVCKIFGVFLALVWFGFSGEERS